MPQALIALLPAIIPAAAAVGTGIYETRAQGEMQQSQQAFQQQQAQQAAQQAQQQAMSQRRQAMMREGPGLQSETSGFLADPTGTYGNVGPGTTGGGSLTPAIENLFPSGGVPSLTEPYPMNVNV